MDDHGKPKVDLMTAIEAITSSRFVRKDPSELVTLRGMAGVSSTYAPVDVLNKPIRLVEKTMCSNVQFTEGAVI